jgi:hypothetical protein
MTDTMTSQNIDLSSWDSLYIAKYKPNETLINYSLHWTAFRILLCAAICCI